MNTIWIKYLFITLSLISLSGCTIFKPLEGSPTPINIPNAYITYHNTSQQKKKDTNTYWWESFNSQELNELIQKALNDNFDIKTAWAKLAQSEANIKILKAPLFPFFDTNATITHQKNNPNNKTKNLTNQNNTLSIGIGASYEIDLWGRIRSGYKAGILNHQANIYDLYTAMMTIAANIADTWIIIAGTQEELSLLEKQINTNKLLLENQLLRYNNAMASGLDILQQQELLIATESEKPLLEMQLCMLHTQLALLLGSYSNTLPYTKTTELPSVPQIPYVGIPSDLIIQRPDIQSAWNKLNAAKWNTSAAKANLLPSIRLTATLSSNNNLNENILSNWITNLSSALTAPIFYGGKLTAEVEKNIALVEEQVHNYGKIVAQALGEVEDALSNEYHQAQLINRLSNQLNYATIAWTESLNSYLDGRDTFLRYITLLQNVQNLERRVVREKTKLLRYRIALYRALGGSWTENIEKEQTKDITH